MLGKRHILQRTANGLHISYITEEDNVIVTLIQRYKDTDPDYEDITIPLELFVSHFMGGEPTFSDFPVSTILGPALGATIYKMIEDHLASWIKLVA